MLLSKCEIFRLATLLNSLGEKVVKSKVAANCNDVIANNFNNGVHCYYHYNHFLAATFDFTFSPRLHHFFTAWLFLCGFLCKAKGCAAIAPLSVQVRMAEIFQEVFGNKLVKENLVELYGLDRLPSPHELQGKIILKGTEKNRGKKTIVRFIVCLVLECLSLSYVFAFIYCFVNRDHHFSQYYQSDYQMLIF